MTTTTPVHKQAPAPAVNGSTVTVACKLPHGMICRIFYETMQDEPVLGGGIRQVRVWKETGEEFRILGFASPEGISPVAQMTQGFALTPGIPKDLWDQWLSQNQKHAAVKNGLIFAHEKTQMTIDESKEKKMLKSGLERLDPNNLPQRLKTADEQVNKVAA